MFRTEIFTKPSTEKISFKTPLLAVGSCFANVMGEKLKENKLPVVSNPFGVIFNPVSLFSLISDSLEQRFLEDSSYVQNQDLYYNLNLHSAFSALKLHELKKKVDKTFVEVGDFLKHTNWVIITLGTAWAYEYLKNNTIVANCHKIPSSQFNKKLLNCEGICTAFAKMYKVLKNQNKNIKFILTVSPVRHIKDTIELNAVSKATLRLACHQIINSHQNVEYFPSFEMMMDDLRDYRFYKKDMIHPSEVAEDYIWHKFVNRYFSESTQKAVNKWQEIKKSISHEPFHPESQTHQKFLKKTLEKLLELENTIDLHQEIDKIKKQIL